MSNNDDIRSPFFGSMQRRSLLKLFGTSAIAIAGSSALSLPALTQQRSDNPTDCAPPGVAGNTAVAFTPNPHVPVRTRKSAFELSNTEVDRLKSAYAALRKLTTQNPNDRAGGCAKAMFIAGIAAAAATAARARKSTEAGYFFHGIARSFIFTNAFSASSSTMTLSRCLIGIGI